MVYSPQLLIYFTQNPASFSLDLDAFVEVRFSDFEVQRTQICRKTLNPVWNEDFRFEVEEELLIKFALILIFD